MVSLWPWKGKDESPASFEKRLSTLSKKITDTQARLDRVRASSRRVKLLWTLYMSFAYVVFAIVMLFVVGRQNLGAWEWSGMAGGPLAIYIMRMMTASYFSFRIESLETHLKEQQAERASTIQKLKEATKYDSTLELLEKYGGEKRPKAKRQGTFGDEDAAAQNGQEEQQKNQRAKKGGRHSMAGPNPSGRTNIAPPPTANIQRPRSAGAGPSTPDTQFGSGPMPPQQQQHLQPPAEPSAEFAPNAGPVPQPYSQNDVYNGAPRWFDRVMDMMLGEDETAPKNRFVLICKNCRLINGQAPPGTRSLAELGTWKCMSCGTPNGEMDEGKKIMHEVLGGAGRSPVEDNESTNHRIKVEDVDDEDESFHENAHS